MAKILQITAVSAVVVDDDPPCLVVTVYGTAISPGWTDLKLVPLEDEISDDGVYDLEFVGAPPDGAAPQLMTPVVGSGVFRIDPKKIVGVLAHGRTNSQYAPVRRVSDTAQGMAQGLAPMGTEPLPMPYPPIPPYPFFPPPAIPFPGPIPTTPSFDDPRGTTQIAGEEGPTTLVVGEEGGPTGGRGGPFGSWG